MRTRLRTSIALGLATLTAGCAALGSDEQAHAGLTVADLKFCESVDPTKDRYLCGIAFRDGKEKESVSLEVAHPTGVTVTYAASAVKAFQAHEIRAAVEKAIADTGKEVVPDVVEAIVKAVSGQ